MTCALWKIEGDASNNAGGGFRVAFTLTNDADNPPTKQETQEALEKCWGPLEVWYRIDKIVLLADDLERATQSDLTYLITNIPDSRISKTA